MPQSREVLIPYRPGGCAYRERAWEWCRTLYDEPTLVSGPPGPWIKALAVMPAIAASEADVVAVVDADVHCPGLEEAFEAVEAGAPWALAHTEVYRLTEAATVAYMAGADLSCLELTQPEYVGIQGGGAVIGRREVLLSCPMDPRFIGWGQEDHAWGFALHTIHGPAWRSGRPLVHLYHPPAARLDRKCGSPEGWALFRAYDRARSELGQMQRLIREAHASLDAHKHTLHADSALGVG